MEPPHVKLKLEEGFINIKKVECSIEHKRCKMTDENNDIFGASDLNEISLFGVPFVTTDLNKNIVVSFPSKAFCSITEFQVDNIKLKHLSCSKYE